MHGERRIWALPLLIAGLVAAIGWWANQRVREVIEDKLRQELRTVLDANVTALEIWMANQKRMALSLAEAPSTRDSLLSILAGGAADETNGREAGRNNESAHLGGDLQGRLRSLGYEMAHLVDTNFMVVADSGRGRNRPRQPVDDEHRAKYSALFSTGEPIIITPFLLRFGPPRRPPAAGSGRFNGPAPERGPGPESRSAGPRGDGFRFMPDGVTNRGSRRRGSELEGEPRRFSGSFRGPPADISLMQVAVPVRDATNAVRGALALIINPEAEFSRILSVARPGDSGETFAFDPEGVMISKSRFDPELKWLGLIPDTPEATSALNLPLRDPGRNLLEGPRPGATRGTAPLIRMVARALEGADGAEVERFRDYRGVPVVGAWRWLPRYGFGVGTKIDATEAFRPLTVVQAIFTILFLLLVLCSLIIFFFSYRSVIWRRRLTEAELKAQRLGQYTLEEKIGEGGMGAVYRARHALLRRATAIKLLPPEKTDAQSIRRFEREVQLTCRLTHPNTIQVYDYGRTPEGIFYYAMEFLEGLNLQDLVHRYGPQPDERVIHVLHQVCDSLHEAHALGLIHRDIKPANVFVSDRGGVPDSVKVLDFGLARHLREPSKERLKRTASGVVFGTPNFIAPETIRNPNENDARSDLYALGAVGYFLLTGAYLFDGDTTFDLFQKHVSECPLPPSARVQRPVCPVLEAALMRCLEKDPAGRPQTSRELQSLLTASARAGAWTFERRAAWWETHRKTRPPALIPIDPVTPRNEDGTVQIKFAEDGPRS